MRKLNKKELLKRIKSVCEYFVVQPHILFKGKEINTESQLRSAIKKAIYKDRLPITITEYDLIMENVKLQNQLKEKNNTIWNLKETLNQVINDRDTLDDIVKLKQKDIQKRNQIIKILDKGYKSFHMTGKAAMDFSKEAKTMTYNDMQKLQITLENIVKGVE